MSIWGKENNKIARKQLGLDDSYSIFVESLEVEFNEDMRGIAEEMAEEMGNCNPTEVVDEIEEKTKYVMLPKGLMLVGMSNKNGGEKFGIVDFSEVKYE